MCRLTITSIKKGGRIALEKKLENKKPFLEDEPLHKDDMVKDLLGDKSAYGEFVATFHAWTGLEGTHKRGAELQEKGKPKMKQDNPFVAKTKEE